MKKEEKIIVLFDGVCNFCNATVNFILLRNRKDRFRFAALQSDIGKKLLKEYHLPADNNSIVVISNGKVYRQSAAILIITRNLSGAWSLLYVFVIIPPFIRNGLYRWFARNRYKWFGKTELCMIPDENVRNKFLV